MVTHIVDTQTKQTIEILDQDFLFEVGQELIIIVNGSPKKTVVKQVTFFVQTAGSEPDMKGSLSQKVFV